MARRPAILERAGALTPRDRIWAAIRCFGRGDTFSVAEIIALSGQHRDTVLSYVKGLAAGGYVKPFGQFGRPLHAPRREFQRFHLLRDTGVAAPRVDCDGETVTQGVGRQNMWDEVRRSRADFNWRDLAFAASTKAHPIAEREAQDYVRFLKLAGYLQVVERVKKGPGGRPERLRFVRSRNTGPRAPIVTREKQVMDGNTGAIVYDPKAKPE